MKYSKIKAILKIVHRKGYKKLQGFPLYEKCFQINNFYLMNTLSITEILFVRDLEGFLLFVDNQKYKELLMHAITHDRFMTD